MKYCFKRLMPQTQTSKGVGKTPPPPGHPDTLTPGRADCLIPKCFRLQPDGHVKRYHTPRKTCTRKHIQFGYSCLIEIINVSQMQCRSAVSNPWIKMDTGEVLGIWSVHRKVKGFYTWYKILFGIYIRVYIFPKLLGNRFLITLFMSLSVECTKPLKLLYYICDIFQNWMEVQAQKVL